MTRVALIAPSARLRAMLVAVADSGQAQLVGSVPAPQGEAAEALRRLQRARGEGSAAAPRLASEPIESAELERRRREDLLAGEVELDRRARASLHRDGFAVLIGWVPSEELEELRARLAEAGAAAVELSRPALVEPPTLLRPRGVAAGFRGLVDTYGAVPYADLDPTPFAAVAFLVMFGMMFGDVGHGLALVALGLALRRSRSPRLRQLRGMWPFAVGGGLVAACFGLLYGEAFGPTGLVPTLWLKPLDQPGSLLAIGVVVGALLLAVSYAIGIANRWRESGLGAALRAPSGIAGLTVFVGAGLLALGVLAGSGALAVCGGVVVASGAALLFTGFLAAAGRSGTGVAEASIEAIDAIIRLAANVVSFTRLAAFGMMHAALGLVVFDGAASLWSGGLLGKAAAVLVFAIGNAVAFALEALVAGVQAMRLAYYELFSRVFAGEGEPFAPWRIPVVYQRQPA
jgi:V/A-type H+-transporting ATPase subunit I